MSIFSFLIFYVIFSGIVFGTILRNGNKGEKNNFVSYCYYYLIGMAIGWILFPVSIGNTISIIVNSYADKK